MSDENDDVTKAINAIDAEFRPLNNQFVVAREALEELFASKDLSLTKVAYSVGLFVCVATRMHQAARSYQDQIIREIKSRSVKTDGTR